MQKKRMQAALSFLVLLPFVGCSEMSDPSTTEVATATGGVMGAGLGAVIGSATGDAGGGLVLGALAGAGTGAVVGGAFEAQEDAIRSQDEALERQEQLIRAQRAEINELKRLTQDSVQFQDGSGGPRASLKHSGGAESSVGSKNPKDVWRVPVRALKLPGASSSRSGGTTAANRGSFSSPRTVTQAPSSEGAIVEKSLTPPVARPPLPKNEYAASSKQTVAETVHVEREQVREPQVVESVTDRVEVAQEQTPSEVVSRVPNTTECQSAAQEVQQARGASETADQLFHYRRALRLCPESPEFHVGLGEVYVQLGRADDAEYEFREALRLDPTYRMAVLKLGELNKPARY